jgi:hypothetical protein
MKKTDESKKSCANGCGAPVRGDGRYCEACELEWLLYRRDLRTAPGAEAKRPETRL